MTNQLIKFPSFLHWFFNKLKGFIFSKINNDYFSSVGFFIKKCDFGGKIIIKIKI